MSATQRIYRSRWYYTAFNNAVSPRINLPYLFNWMVARSRSKPEAPSPRWSFDTKGVERVGGVIDPAEARRCSDAITSVVGARAAGDGNYVAVPQPLDLFGVSLVRTMFSSTALHDRISAYFQSHYRAIWCDCYRSFPTAAAATSWLWHSDNVPAKSLKAMLLLTDVTVETGAMLALSRRNTNMVRSRGYFGVRVGERHSDLSPYLEQGEKAIEYATGSAGDVMLFDNNNLHKAVAPQHGYRDVMTFLVVPAAQDFRTKLDDSAFLAGLDDAPGGYPASPFRY